MSETENTALYRERVLPRSSSFLPLLLVPPITLLTFIPFLDLGGLWIGFGIIGLALVGIWFSAPVIEIDRNALYLNDIELPHANIGKITIIPASEAFTARGTGLNAAAFTRFQSSVKTMVRVEVRDSNDPTPYWLFSTRKPELVAEVLRNFAKPAS